MTNYVRRYVKTWLYGPSRNTITFKFKDFKIKKKTL